MKKINKERLFFVGFLILLFLIGMIGCADFKEIEGDKSFVFISCSEDISEEECMEFYDRQPQSVGPIKVDDIIIVNEKELAVINGRKIYYDEHLYSYRELQKDIKTCIKDLDETVSDGSPCPFDPLFHGRASLIKVIIEQYDDQMTNYIYKTQIEDTFYGHLLKKINTSTHYEIRRYFLSLHFRHTKFIDFIHDEGK